MWFKKIILLIFTLLPISEIINAQHADQIYISHDGIMHWSRDSSEVTGFGENYTVPFAYGYRAGKRLGIDLEAAIDQDVYQFARLGLDLFRVHVWDCEISDTLGNLLDNEHLQLFDYLLWKLKLKGINAIITPIAYWGNGWPEKDEPTPGFSTRYGKDNCLTNPEAIKAQEKYLYQFVNHINRYTGIAYKNDSQILAFEVCNEPHHKGSPGEVTAFVKKMKEAIRSTGCTKPVFYNVSHRVHLEQAYIDAGIDGGTFQWYPTGLGFQKELGGNMLPNVDKYEIPFDDILKKNHAARFVYEFDAADMATSYMYPAMARSFRSAGMQMATHFAWDPSFSAPFNTEYNTHYMNLFYAPQKALSLMICAEVFRNIPLYSDYGVYPDNTSFGPFRVSYEENLAEMVTDEKFIYTNNTNTKPPAPDKLELIAGWGTSPLVEYEGTGAYFLDHLGDGIWKLELFPDAIRVDNLFGRNSLDKTRAVIKEERRKIKIHLPGLEEGFAIESIDWRDSILYRETKNETAELKPGMYLLTSLKYQESDSILLDSKRKIELENFVPFPDNVNQTWIQFLPPEYWSADQDIKFEATIVSNEKIDSVVVSYQHARDTKNGSVKMKLISGDQYGATIPSKELREGRVDYNISVYAGHQKKAFAPRNDGKQNEAGNFTLDYIAPSDPIKLFDAKTDYFRLNRKWVRDSKLIYSEDSTQANLYLKLDGLVWKDDENPNAPPVADYTMRHYFGDLVAGRKHDLPEKKSLVLQAFNPGAFNFPVQVSLVMKDGSAFGSLINLNSVDRSYSVNLNDFKRVRAVLLPRPYPTFLPYFSSAGKADHLDISQIESLQISIGPGIKEEDWGKVYEVMISGVWLE